MNGSKGDNHVNINIFLNNEYVNICIAWHRLYNFFPGGRDTDIIDLNYKKRIEKFCLRTKSFVGIILKSHSWCQLRLSFQK